MIIKNGTIHDGKGNIFVSDIEVVDGKISKIDNNLSGEDVVDASGLHVFPGFIQTLSNWGINGTASEIRPSSDDNDELSDPITPHLDVKYAFNGRSARTQQLGAFGLTTIGVTPTDNNLFGGSMAEFEVDGLDPFKMCLNPKVGLKASVSKKIKLSYGSKGKAPMTKMWIFEQFEELLTKASKYDPSDEKTYDAKLEALKEVTDGKLPLFVSCDNATDIMHVKNIVSKFENIHLYICNCFGLKEDDEWILDGVDGLVVRQASATYDKIAMELDLNAIAKFVGKGMPVALSGVDSSFEIREDVLWLGINMMKVVNDEKIVLPMMTSIPAKMLNVDSLTGSIEVGKRADIVLWSDNPLLTYKAEIITTYQKGEVIYKKGDELRCI